MGRSTASAIVKETCAGIYDGLKDAYLKVPNTAQEWKKISQEFRQKWNYSFCVGASDGKHIRIKNPESAGSLYYNYKKLYSIVLLALVDAGYRFIYVDIGAPGHNGDAGIYDNCTLKVAIENKLLNLPDPEIILGTEKTFCHYHIIGDEAFALHVNIMKPDSHRNLDRDIRIFNYRLSRARRVVENAFGILANRFRVFHTSIGLEPEHVEILLLACCSLHNYLITNQSAHYVSHFIEDEPRENVCRLTQLQPTTHRNASTNAKTQREDLKSYFLSEDGKVPWQDRMIDYE